MTASQVRLTEVPAVLPRDISLPGLYPAALRHLTGRLASSVARTALRVVAWSTTVQCAPPEDPTARNRAVGARHPSTLPRLSPHTTQGDPL